MTCEEVERRDVAEEYLLGRLTDADQDAFERHYFECADCYARLEALGAVKDALHPASTAPATRARTILPWMALAAAVILVAAGTALVWRTGPSGAVTPAPSVVTARPDPGPPSIPADVIQLARIEPPAYAPSRLRSGPVPGPFESAMTRYQSRDFAAAIPLLEAVVRGAPGDEAARFYLGASCALTSRWSDAVATLQPLLLRPESAYAEEAAFITARAHVHLGDVAAAIAALDTTIALGGDRDAEARDLRARLVRK